MYPLKSAMTKMNMLMTQPVTGSRMTNLFPRNMPPPIPISDPVEGTIVTVLREAAAGAGRSSATSLVEVARAAADAGAVALDRTASQLPALTRAGVVDAGGRGLLVLLDTMVEVLVGGPTPSSPTTPSPTPPRGATAPTGARRTPPRAPGTRSCTR